MKKLLLSGDEYIYQYNGQYYLREFGHVLISRYLCVFDNVKVAFRTKVVTTKTDLEEYYFPVNDNRIQVFQIPFFRGPKEYAQNYFKINKVFKQSISECNVAIIRIPSTIGFAILNHVRKNRIPFAVEVVANPKDLAKTSNNIITRTLFQIMHFQQLSACKYADGASYVTQFALQKIYPTQKKGNFESYYSSVELKNSFWESKRLYPKRKPFVICHIANPIKTYAKGHITVIDTVKRLTDQGFNVVARFAGDGEYISLFQQYAEKLCISDNIEFVGLLKQGQLKQFLIDSDLMLFPSSSEGLPRVIIEAMATGLPCLSTPVGGIPELIPNELIFNADDSFGFATKIAEIMNNEKLYNRLSEAAIKKSKEYSIDNLQSRRIDFYKKVENLRN